jgi:thiol-disulfide isomerase/thioredoxin
MPSSILSCLVVAFAIGQGGPAGLDAVSKAAIEIRNSTYAEAKAEDERTGKTTARADIEARIAPKLAKLLAEVDASKIPAAEASRWSQLYRSAGMGEVATRLETSALTYHNVQLMTTTSELFRAYLQAGEDERALYVLRHAPSLDGSMVGMIGEGALSALRAKGYDRTKPAFVEKCLETLRNRIDLTPNPLPGARGSMSEYAYVDISMKLLELRYERDPSAKVLNEIKALRKRFEKSESLNAFGQPPSHRIDQFLNMQLAIGKSAPEIQADRSIGNFAGLASLRGKVVVLDFMAHWCGPCKAAFPDLRKLQAEYGARGFQMLSITSFYGYYGAQKDLKPEAEYRRMVDFVKSYSLNWPVIFDAKQITHQRYGVSAIPHLVIIDRTGQVQRVQVGNSAPENAKTEALVRELVSAAD